MAKMTNRTAEADANSRPEQVGAKRLAIRLLIVTGLALSAAACAETLDPQAGSFDGIPIIPGPDNTSP